MRVLVIFGSPRKQGNTASILAPFVDEMGKLGSETRIIDVYDKNIGGCQVCLGCQSGDLAGGISCVLPDDMQEILGEIAISDLIVVAAPVYIWSAPAPVKAVLDRVTYASCKYYGDDPHGPSLLKGKKLALLTTCGYPVEKGADLYEEQMKRFCRHCQLEYAGMLAERHRNLKEPFMNEEKEAAARAFAKAISQKL